jgi:hypothetical protein
MSSAFELTQSRRTGGSETGPVSTCGENKAGVAGQPEHICQSAHLAEAGGRRELDWRWRGVLQSKSAKAPGRQLLSTYVRTGTRLKVTAWLKPGGSWKCSSL